MRQVPSNKVFRDPVHVNITFDRNSKCGQMMLRLIDTPQVQRLRHVRQLAVANYVYHGAEHSRFSHSLGVTHFARRICDILSVKDSTKFSKNEELVVMASALLHDIGHPPFSHAVEKVLGVDHELMTVNLVSGDTEVNFILKEFGGGEFVDKVSSHINGTSDEKTTSIISSQLDADRMDYILRDGYHAGVPNSQFDSERILQLMEIDDKGLIYDHRAQLAIESYFIARYHLYQQLYYHKTVRAYEVVLRGVIKRAKQLIDDGIDLGSIDSVLLEMFRDNSVIASVKLTDHDLWAAFRVWQEHDDNILSDLSKRLIKRKPFKSINIRGDNLPNFYENQHSKVIEVAQKAGYHPDYYVITDAAKDTPYKILNITGSGDSFTSVRIKDVDGSIQTLEQRSKIIDTLQRSAYHMIRLCVPEEIRDNVIQILNK